MKSTIKIQVELAIIILEVVAHNEEGESKKKNMNRSVRRKWKLLKTNDPWNILKREEQMENEV